MGKFRRVALIGGALIFGFTIAPVQAKAPNDYTVAVLAGIGLPLVNPIAIPGPTIGASVRYKPAELLAFDFDAYYVTKRYYDFDHTTKVWSGPFPYDKRFENDWSFYETRFFLAAYLTLSLMFDPVEIYGSVGPSITVTIPPDSYSYYPEFAALFDASSRKNAQVGLAVKTGFRVAIDEFFTFGGEILFDTRASPNLTQSLGQNAGTALLQSTSLVIMAGVRFK